MHYVLAERIPAAQSASGRPSQTWAEVPSVPGAAPIYPRSQTVARFNDLNKANRFTSACGMCIYRDELFGPEFAGNSFVCEPVHNLVHREVLDAAGRDIHQPPGRRRTAQRVPGLDRQLVAAGDGSHRPGRRVMGGRHVSAGDRASASGFPRTGSSGSTCGPATTKGRIYRVYPAGQTASRHSAGSIASRPSNWSPCSNTPAAPSRDLVQQLLVHKQDAAAIEPLKKLVAEGKRPQARLHALCTLDGLEGARRADAAAGLRR